MSLSNLLPSGYKSPLKIFGLLAALKIASIIYQKYLKNVINPEISDKEDLSVNNFEKSNRDHFIEEKLFFTDDYGKNGSYDCQHPPTSATKNLDTLKAYLKSATKSLDVCVYYFTHDDLASLLIESHKKNIQVRVITDAQFATIGVIPRLKEEGIEVRSIYAVSGKMNNKFAIVDKTLLITGSGSWTYQALMNNEENIVVTNNPGFFKDYGYDKYFEQLWAKRDKIEEKSNKAQFLVVSNENNPLTSCLEISTNKPIDDKLIFDDESINCRNHSNVVICNSPTCAVKNFNKLKGYLNLANKTLDVCVHIFTYDLIAQALIKLHKKNVKVRIILDGNAAMSSSLVDDLTSAGIEVKLIKSLHNMHNKFAIIDKVLLITGSADWTSQAFTRNYENIIVTSSPKLIEGYGYKVAFERLWVKR